MTVHFLDDERLSWEAKGMLAFYLREKPSVEIAIGEIAGEGRSGREKTARIIKELKAAGYRQSERYRDESGVFQWETWLYSHRQEA